MPTIPERELQPERLAFNFDQLRDSGLLWLINRVVLHPRGFALALDYADGDKEPHGWSIHAADRGECYMFGIGEQAENDRFRQVEALLAYAREHGRAPIYDHVPAAGREDSA